jgi:hypothetical protein
LGPRKLLFGFSALAILAIVGSNPPNAYLAPNASPACWVHNIPCLQASSIDGIFFSSSLDASCSSLRLKSNLHRPFSSTRTTAAIFASLLFFRFFSCAENKAIKTVPIEAKKRPPAALENLAALGRLPSGNIVPVPLASNASSNKDISRRIDVIRRNSVEFYIATCRRFEARMRPSSYTLFDLHDDGEDTEGDDLAPSCELDYISTPTPNTNWSIASFHPELEPCEPDHWDPPLYTTKAGERWEIAGEFEWQEDPDDMEPSIYQVPLSVVIEMFLAQLVFVQGACVVLGVGAKVVSTAVMVVDSMFSSVAKACCRVAAILRCFTGRGRS